MNIQSSQIPDKLGFLSICWIVFALHFLLSGFVRGFIFPQFSNYLFFVPLPIVICIFFISLRRHSKISYFEFFCILTSVMLLLYQVVMFFSGSITSQTAVYGWFLYGLPFLGMAASQRCLNLNILRKITLLFELCLIPNLFFAIMQTVVGNARYFSAGFGEGLQSAYGVQRATGTFSSPAGYALYLTLTASLLLIRNNFRRTSSFRNLFGFGLLLFQIPISGSRTVIMSVSFVFLTQIFFRKGRDYSYLKSEKSKLLLVVSSLTLIGIFMKFVKSSTVQATATRFFSANEVDPPLTRLFAQLKVDFQGIGPFHGTGLGSRANGTTALGVDWVEFDAQRVLIEAGLIIGIFLLGIRIFLVMRMIENMAKKDHTVDLPLVAAVVPIVLFGQFMGQGTISSGTWLGLYILEYLRTQFELPNEHKTKIG